MRERGVRFGICNEMFEGWAWEDVCQAAAEAGYDGIEVAPFTLAERVTDISAERRRELVAVARKAGLEIIGLHWLLVSPKGLYINTPDDAVRTQTVEYFIAMVHCCADLGGRVMVVGSPKQRNLLPGLSREKAWALAQDSFRRILPAAAARGVTLCLEPLAPEETDFINTAAEARGFVEEINHPNLRLILDVKAMSSEGRPIPDIIRENAQVVAHVHANDANKRGPGFGDTDFASIAAALREIGYQDWVSVEVFDFTPDPVTIARESRRYLRQHFG